MNAPIFYEEKIQKRKINTYSHFILIGNTIDGFLDFEFCEFENFQDVQNRLLKILKSIKFEGEWDIKLYQVDEVYKIKNLYGYYKVPKRGKLIYTHSYMNNPVKEIIFSNDTITFIGVCMDYWENWLEEGEDFHNYEIYLEVNKIKIK